MIHVIANPASHSGKGLLVWEKAEKEFKKLGAEYTVHFTEYIGHSREITKEICANEQRPFTLVAVGGDGSVNEVLTSVDTFEGINFACIPSGSGNDLAGGLKLTKDVEELVAHIVSKENAFPMDFGVATTDGEEPRRFDVSAGIGFDAAVCEENLDSPIKKALNKVHLGKLSYLFIAIKQIFACKRVDMDVTIDDGETRHYNKVFFMAAMNQRYEGGGLAVVPTAVCIDGKLSVGVLYGFPKIKATILIPMMMAGGKHVKLKGVDVFDCKKCEIHATGKSCVHTDGEIMGHFDHVIFECPDEKVNMLV